MSSKHERLRCYRNKLPAVIGISILLSLLVVGYAQGRMAMIYEPMLIERTYAPSTNADVTVTATPCNPSTANVTMSATTGITDDSAQLNGELISTGCSSVNISWRWDTTDYGETDNWTSTANYTGVAVGTMSHSIAGTLSASTLYYAKIRAVNDAGTSWTSTVNFTTSASAITPISGLVLTDLGFTTVSANWTAGSGNYTMIRGLRNNTPLTTAEGELLYYGPASTANMTGMQTDTSEYTVVAWSFAADNITYSVPIIASIGGEGMDEIAIAVEGLTTTFEGGIGINLSILSELIAMIGVILIMALAMWKHESVFFRIMAAPVGIIYGLRLAASDTSDSTLFTVGVVIAVIGTSLLFSPVVETLVKRFKEVRGK